MLSSGLPHFPDQQRKLLLMFEGDRELTCLPSPSFAICPDAISRFLAFLRIACLSRDFRGVGDSAFGTTNTSVGYLSVGTPSFVTGYSATSTTSSTVGDSVVGTPSFVTSNSSFGTTSSAVGDSAVGTPSFPATSCSNVGMMGSVRLLFLSAKFTFAASKYDFDFCNMVVTKFSVTYSVSQFVSASSFGC